MKPLVVISFMLALCGSAQAQMEIIGDKAMPPISLTKPAQKFPYIIDGGDTLAYVYLPTCLILDRHIFKSKRQEKHYWRLVNHVKKVLPYARLAGKRYKELNDQLINKSEGERLILMRRVEKEIKRDFSKEVQNMTITQGRILLKLIDRETGVTAYNVVKELRGSFSAMFWQSVSVFFDGSLKSEYDPEGDDKEIESIIYLIDRGLL